ncbi:MAG: DegT/DnrJ/EryC1/StrS family aminotransferase [Deltaproteobacteria bacterium]|jgi:dTDP-4-amino-4,6-dideoxygalactose transaminase|nr:DegT/DnrJ/EryC1/StrS family aminotransferase [Deltaproteobacteria bacterium]
MEVPILKIPFDCDDVRIIGEELSRMLLSGSLAMGDKSRLFEEKFADFVGSRWALGCQSGTQALELIARGLNLSGYSVIVPGLTFMATAMAFIAAGAKIAVADVDPELFQLAPNEAARMTRADTRAIVLVHLGGFISPKWRDLKTLAQEHCAYLIEDSAHAHGAIDNGAKAGTLGTAAAFSFYPTKVLTTAEGGMVTTDDPELHRKMLILRQHGQENPGSNIHEHFGLNFRPSEIHALLGLRQMEKADWILNQRRQAAEVYDQLLVNSPLTRLLPPENQKPAYYKYITLLPDKVSRSHLKERLKKEFQVSLAGEVYTIPLNKQPFLRNNPHVLGTPLTPLPQSEKAAESQICLPIWPGLTKEAQEYVVDCVLKCLN